MAERIQLKRAKGWKMPPNTVKVDRTTRYGNPFKVTEDRTEAECASAFHTWLHVETAHAGMPEQRAALLAALPQLRGKNLACWCKPRAFCHADVLLEMANADGVPVPADQTKRTAGTDSPGGADEIAALREALKGIE